jgi:endonuclease-8
VPEGDVVWRTAHHLDKALSGQVLTGTDFRVPAHATLDLSGRLVVRTLARGKHLLTRIGEGEEAVTLHTHLKMEGSWHLYREGTRWRRPAHEARVVLTTREWTAVGFALGVVEVVPWSREEDIVGHLGPDLLGPDWDLDEAVRRLSTDADRPVSEGVVDPRDLGAGTGTSTAAPSQRAIGEALLDQRLLAGIGNVYKAEALFLAGVSPFRAVAEVPDLRKLVNLARRLMLANRDSLGIVTTGVNRRGAQHWVYGRAGEPCRRCGTRIESAQQGPAPYDRVTFWCPTCQR